jgi:hypothetical protein
MTTIFVINAVSSLVAAAGIAGFLARAKRRGGKPAVALVYVTPRAARSRTRH